MTFHVYIYTTGTGMSIRGLLRVPGKIPEARPILLLDTHTHCAENARRCEASLPVDLSRFFIPHRETDSTVSAAPTPEGFRGHPSAGWYTTAFLQGGGLQ